jgi:hypothetical protein
MTEETKKETLVGAVMDPVTGTLPIMLVGDGDAELTPEEAAEEEFLAKAFSDACEQHQAEADRIGAEIYNFGWSSSFGSGGCYIYSKTSRGFLDTTWIRETGEVTHSWSS